MHRIISGVAVAAIALFGLAAPQASAAPNERSNPLLCFTDDSGAECTRQGGSFTLEVEPGEWAGVYVEEQSLAGEPLSDLDLRFSYEGSTSGGSPRLAIPVDTGSDVIWLFADTACDADQDGTVLLGEDGCIVSDSNGYYGTFADYVAAHPDYVVGDGYTFIVADQPGLVTVSDIKLGRTPPGHIK